MRFTSALPVLVTTLTLTANTPAPSQCSQLSAQELLSSDRDTDDQFGTSVAVDGDVMVIGAPMHDDLGTDSGAAYVYRLNGTVWQEQEELLAPDGTAKDNFGQSVAVHGDLIVVGAYSDTGKLDLSGSAYIFRDDGTTWQLEQKITSDVEVYAGRFGYRVAADGPVIAVGAFGESVVYVFRESGSGWNLEQRLTPSTGNPSENFGHGLAVRGNDLLAGASGTGNSGTVFAYSYNGSVWSEDQVLTPADGGNGDKFGASLAMDAGKAVIGSRKHFVSGGTRTGAAYVYRRGPNKWLSDGKLFPSDGAALDEFGASVSMRGGLIAVGANLNDDIADRTGAVWSYRDSTQGWVRISKNLPADGVQYDEMGTSVAVSGATVVAGAPYHNDGLSDGGSAYVFPLNDLHLMATPAAVSPGQTLNLITCGGLPGGGDLLAVTSVTGVPTFVRLAFGLFDAQGLWTYSAPVSPGFSGLFITVQSFGFYLPGTIGVSDPAPVLFL